MSEVVKESEAVNESQAVGNDETPAVGPGGRFFQTLDPSEPIPDPYSLPLEDINMVFPRLFQEDAIWPYFDTSDSEATQRAEEIIRRLSARRG